ncbi:MAG: extracellular solute-binding protein [Neisseriaceae bacterium]|nr:extracellular solute-binding protein [Neisseriaceae bacterium]MBP6861774.1 extracellular solute-binding protein [Neisseriaceae bacterium]
MYQSLILLPLLAACGGDGATTEPTEANSSPATAETLASITEKAKAEGRVNSVGMPDTWANWQGTWADLKRDYGLAHQDTDMSSAQEIAKFAAEKDNATADIGDVGISFGPIAAAQGVTQPYKTSYWDQIPDWAKDKDGHWLVGYTGTIAFIVNKEAVPEIPRSWADLKNGRYKVHVGDVSSASQAVNGVLAANYALGGTEADLTPALTYFADLAKQKRLGVNDPIIANLEKGEVTVGIVWDFNGLNYRNQINPERFEVVIPSDGSVVSGYATIINKHAKNPNAAKLTREYILSDAGQLNLARGFARPIRADALTIPADIQKNLLPNEQYASAKPIQDFATWEKTAKALPGQWQQQVLIHQQ